MDLRKDWTFLDQPKEGGDPTYLRWSFSSMGESALKEDREKAVLHSTVEDKKQS